MNIIKTAESEPTMTVVSMVNERSASTKDEDDYDYDYDYNYNYNYNYINFVLTGVHMFH